MRFIYLAFILLAQTMHARDGSFTGNGADRKGPGYGAAWFLGDRTVHWCGNDEAIGPALEGAVSKWSDYMAKKEIERNLHAPVPFALRFLHQESCAGADLEIVVRTERDAEVFSSSELLEQDMVHGSGRGRIWLSSALPRPALETQLIHQVGHLLGHDHVGGTVMAEEIASLRSEPPVLLSIDGTRELYLNLDRPANFRSADGRIYREENGSASISSPNGVLPLRFTELLANTDYGDAKLFTVAFAEWKGHLQSQSVIRLGVFELDGKIEQVIVRRNFNKLVEIHRLVQGRPELFFEATGECSSRSYLSRNGNGERIRL